MNNQYIRIIIQFKGGSARNDVGGTTLLDKNRIMHAVVIKDWEDYETGHRFIGKLTNPDDIEYVKSMTTTEWKDKYPDYDPATVYFSEWEMVKKLEEI